uniref:EGF-like domain-containing protein n=1 Tax=Strongyloides venezuelensis TaxID=75913 RepID=A0A0K0FGE8_STRVS
MLVKILPILFIISNDISSYSQNNDYESVVIQENNCPFTLLAEQKIITIRFNALKKYDTEQRQYENIKFKEIRILHLEWDEVKRIALHGKLCGLTVGIDDTSIRKYNITYSTGYYVGHNFDNIIEPIYCNIQQCDLGLVFFDRTKNAEILNDLKKNHTVEHAVLMVVKSSDNKMLLGIRSHHKVNIILGICPYINWVQKKGVLKFIPEEHIRDNGYTEESNKFSHIVVPFYKKNENSDEFICGKLKQPTMPDFLIGFKLSEDNEDKTISEDINPLEDELKCKSGGAIEKHCHFGYLEKDTNYMSERIMEVIKVRSKSLTYNFYAGQKIYIYFCEKIFKSLENTSKHLRLKKPHITERVSCIRNLKKGIKANILPSIGSVDSIKKNERLNIFYRLIQPDDLNKKHSFRCLSKVNGTNKAHMEEFYSRTAKFSIKSEEDPNIVYTSSKNEIAFIDKEIKNYGSYRCKESDPISLFDKNFITMDKVYYLPYEGAEMKFVESHVDDTYQSDIGCNKQYETFGELKKMTIIFGQNVSDPISIEDFSNSTDTIDIKEGKIIYKPPKDVLGVTIECTYKTPAETTFYTRKDTFISKSHDTGVKNNATKVITKEKVVTQVKNNSTPWVIGIVIAVILFCTIVIVVAYLIVRRIKKRRAENSLSLSFTGVSNLSKSSSKGSRSMSGSKSKTRGGSRSTSKSNASKTARSGKNSKSGTRSSNFTSNTTRNSKSTTSTNRGKNYYNNVKLAAK